MRRKEIETKNIPMHRSSRIYNKLKEIFHCTCKITPGGIKMTENWDLINKEIEDVVRLISKEGLGMVSGTFGTEDEINNWQYKIWLLKKHQKKVKSK